MSSSTFGEVQYDTPADEQYQSPGVNGHTAAEEVPLDDPRLLSSENVDTNETGDAYAAPPVLPDGKYRAKLTLAKIKDNKGAEQDFRTSMATWRTPPIPFYCVNIQSEIIDHSGKFDGYKLTEYWVKTLVGDRGPGQGTSQLATIVRASGGKIPVGANQKQVLDAGMRHMASEPEVLIETQWEASCEACQKAAKAKGEKSPKPFLTGMHRFPQPRTGVYTPEVQCPVCHQQSRAQVRIRQYFAVAAAPQAIKTA